MSRVFRLDRRAVGKISLLTAVFYFYAGLRARFSVDQSEYRHDLADPAWPVFAARLSPVSRGHRRAVSDRPAGLSLSGCRHLSGRGSALAVFHPVYLAGLHGAVRQYDADPAPRHLSHDGGLLYARAAALRSLRLRCSAPSAWRLACARSALRFCGALSKLCAGSHRLFPDSAHSPRA